MSGSNRSISAANLQDFLGKLFSTSGMPLADANFCAKALVQTNLWGIDSHGVLRAPIYLQRLHSRAMNPTPAVKKVRGSGVLEVLDGDDGAGFVVGRAAMNRAIELAQQFSMGAVGVIRSNHFGAAGLFARMAVEQGLIGLVMTSVMPNIVAPGGSRPITGNNPIAIGIPTFGGFPFVLDISLSNVAGGKLLLASKKGEQIPLDWATDRNGRPTSDPDEAFAGFLLPLGAHKGLGLSYVVDILSGLITGGVFQHSLKSMYKYPDDPSLTSHFMIVINPLALMSQDEMQARMAEFQQTIKASPMWDETQEMLLPGELEHRTMQHRLENGIPLPPALVADLQKLGEEHGVAFPLTAAG
ncbi:Ldh family oxidoreductase [Candidatus Leptofilum sp.]|uniref:Ldh family oxidoreductase n=1 Tax=Candidatus Leptofilum sp. TaxID=3241576 RepID=UPI003B5BAFFF